MMRNVKGQDTQGELLENRLPGEAELREDDTAPRLIGVQPEPLDAAEQPLGRVPYISLRAFGETSGFISSINQAAADRRLARANIIVSPGGLRGAVQFFATNATPDLLVIETGLQGDALFLELDALAEVCDANTKIVVIGLVNDISLYRRLMERGVGEYLVSPVGALGLIDVVLRLFPQDEAARLGKVLAFIGAKGGAGSSTVAQNTAWSLAQQGTKVLLADLDLYFGTAALNYNIDAPVGFTEQLAGAERPDEAFFERLLHTHGPNLSILAGATASRDVAPPALAVLDQVLERARATFPFVVLDLPHEWTPWVRQALLSADEVIITAEPDLASLRNARMMFDLLKAERPNDADPLLVLNRIGVVKRDEIKPDEFAANFGAPAKAKFSFAPKVFSQASNSGQMIAVVSPASGRPFMQLAQALISKAPTQERRRFLGWRRRN